MNASVIPVINLSDADERSLSNALDNACRDAGFFYLSGHGVDAALLDQTFDVMRDFFARSGEYKQRYHIRLSHPHQRGYVPLFEENLGEDVSRDFKESFDLGVDLPVDHPDVRASKPFAAPNVWPDATGFQETIAAYHAEMMRISAVLVRLTAEGLGLDPGYFDEAMGAPVANLRLLHYPPGASGDDVIGCGAHTDYGFMTILAQDDVGGLEIEGPDGVWIKVPPRDGCFVVNLGDLLTLWTSGRYKARKHRVAGSGARARYSIPFFLDPNVDAMIATVPTCRSSEGPQRPPISAGDFLQSRFDATFNYREKAASNLAIP